MEQLIKKVEDFRTHIRIHNFFDYLLFFILGANSIIEISFKNNFGVNFYYAFTAGLMVALSIYYYKSRRNLPFPKEISKESMENYQIKQLKRYLSSVSTVVWWGLLPITQAALGTLTLKFFSGTVSFFAIIFMIVFILWAYWQEKRFFYKYLKNYEELGGNRSDFWFRL
jgi:hypothetical protein